MACQALQYSKTTGTCRLTTPTYAVCWGAFDTEKPPELADLPHPPDGCVGALSIQTKWQELADLPHTRGVCWGLSTQTRPQERADLHVPLPHVGCVGALSTQTKPQELADLSHPPEPCVGALSTQWNHRDLQIYHTNLSRVLGRSQHGETTGLQDCRTCRLTTPYTP